MAPFHRLLAFVSFAVALGALPAVAGAPARGHAAPAQPPPYGWPELLHDSFHTSVSPNSAVSTDTASTLGIWWMAPMRAADLGSPVTAYNATLQKTVVYVGTERGDVIAYDESNGTTLWSTSVGYGDAMRATPMVGPDGSVWVATAYGSTLWKLNGATGAVACSIKQKIHFDASPQFATPPGGVPSVFIATNDIATAPGPQIAVRQDNCKLIWSFTKYLTNAGAWASTAFGVDATGKGRVYVGTSDPDSTEYALDANTGQEVWHFSIVNPPPGVYDIGAAATVSPPGNNGFAQGVLYVPTKYGILDALNLTTGKLIWAFNFNKQAKVNGGGRSSAALYGKTLVYGMANGVEAVDAVKGTLLWHYIDPAGQEVISSPAVAGPKGKEIVAFGDVTGAFRVLSLATGQQLYSYQTLNYITSSPSIINGHIQIDSTDGFLYDFAINSYNPASPTTAITSPATGSTVPNPAGNLTVTGTASDAVGVTEVIVTVQRAGPTGTWYDSANGKWSAGPVNNFVAVVSPAATNTTWSFPFPVPPAGSTYQVTVNAVDLLGQVDRTGAQSSFTVMPNPKAPSITPSTSVVAPGQSLSVFGSAFRGGEKVDYTLQGALLGKGTANKSGFVPKITIKVPVTDAFGPSALIATGETSKKMTTAALDVTNVWGQTGYDATHAGYEPNDPVLAQTLQATNKGYLSRAWYYVTAGKVDVGPAVAAGSAYVGDVTGQVAAVDTASGAPFWTYNTPDGSAVHGAPAVDGASLFFGADDGKLYALNAGTGALVGTIALDGVPAAPSLAGGTIYSGTDNGTVYAIAETSGSPLWSRSVGAAVHHPPAVDVAKGIVFVGDDSGNVTMLKLADGTVLGTIATGSTITAAPMLNAGTLFVGSTDGTLRTYDEATGTPGFTFAAGAAIEGLAATGKELYVASDQGQLAYLDESTGRKIYMQGGFGSAIVGLGTTVDVPIVETTAGVIGAIKDDQGGRIAWLYPTNAALSSAPVVVDGTVYVGAQDGGLYAFDNHGQPPQSILEHLMLRKMRQSIGTPVRWIAGAAGGFPATAHAFAPHGPRVYPLHLDRPGTHPAVAATVSPGRTYALVWAPGASAAAANAQLARIAGSGIAGSVVETRPLPRAFDDGDVQRELTKELAATGWRVAPNAQFVVIVPSGRPASARPYCAYHSAFDLGGAKDRPVVYGVIGEAANGCDSSAIELQRLRAEIAGDPFARGR